MAKQEREIESLILKEQRSLITSGMQSEEIKIRGKSLYVSNALYGRVHYVDSEFKFIQVKSHPSISIISSTPSIELLDIQPTDPQTPSNPPAHHD